MDLTAGAEVAAPALRLQREDHLVAGGDGDPPRADLLDDAGRLVPEDHRQRRRQLPVDEVQVGVADAAVADPYADLAGSRRLDLHVVDNIQLPTLPFQQRCAHASDCNDGARAR